MLNLQKNLWILCKVNHQSDYNVVRDDLDILKQLILLISTVYIIKNKLLQLKKEIAIFKDEIKEAMMKLEKLKEALDIFYEIKNDIFNKLEMKNRNYQSLENIELINNNEIFNRLKEINEWLISKIIFPA